MYVGGLATGSAAAREGNLAIGDRIISVRARRASVGCQSSVSVGSQSGVSRVCRSSVSFGCQLRVGQVSVECQSVECQSSVS